MKILGLDIGTTNIAAVVAEHTSILCTMTEPNGTFLPGIHPWEKIQNPDAIREKATRLVRLAFDKYPDIGKIGVTGQMHGILYLDTHGNPLRPLYTWQDGSGDQPYSEEYTYASYLSARTGYPLSTGYGLVTHFYHLKNGLVPENTAVFCTIHDYIAMVLAGSSVPVTDPSDAASMGFFDIKNARFDAAALLKAGMDPALLPQIASSRPIGMYEECAAVYPAIGDNQASFLGACGSDRNRMLVNIGTGGQFSVYSEEYMICPGLETRPFPGGGYLLVGSSLCSGRAYALLERFFRSAAEMTAAPVSDCYTFMDALLSACPKPDDLPVLLPLFQGTRDNPSLSGSITGLTTENFTPLHLIHATLDGIAGELCSLYRSYLAAGGKSLPLIGSGNGLRKNRHLRDAVTKAFGQELTMSGCAEEAAAGAAVYASLSEN